MERAYVIVDNLKIGGYQRLSLDQAYALADLEFAVSIVALSPKDLWDAAKIEYSELKQKNIELVESASGRFELLRFLHRFIPKNSSNVLIISHSLRATFALRLIKILFNRKFTINTTLHQLPRLSHFSQRVKRFIYSQFTDNLFCFSRAAELDWYSQFGETLKAPLHRFSKRIKVMRNGIYLDRLPINHQTSQPTSAPRIIFLGRLSFWKGLNTIKMMANSEELRDFDFVLMVPAITPDDLHALNNLLGPRLCLIEGKSVASLASQKGDVHIYPANYGSEVKFIESISLNCLEMCAMGIPSVVTFGGLVTWPELSQFQLVHEVDWSNIKEIESAIRLSQRLELNPIERAEVRKIIDIHRQIESYLKTN